MKKGFSIAELLIVIAIMLIFAGLFFASFSSRKSKTTLDLTARQIVSFLREAQSRSIAQEKDYTWGVVFKNNTSSPSFYGVFYNSTSTMVKTNNLPAGIEFGSSTIPLGGSLVITFSKITGIPSTSTVIYLYSNQPQFKASSSISINISGAIDFSN
jgi:prepilin-type N-terminal cleavage/methylation domain-containing protein